MFILLFIAVTIDQNGKLSHLDPDPANHTGETELRGAVPASCYFEWEHREGPGGKKVTGRKYRLQTESALTWLCGLYRMEEGVPCFVILTREAGDRIRFIHDRMPLILPEQCIDAWISPETRPEDLLDKALTEMVCGKA